MAKAKLDDMFHMDDDDDEDILTYAPPKVPQKPKTESSTNSDSMVLKASVVQCFRLVDGQYQQFRKLGIAVLYYPKKRDCRIVLYASRDKQIALAQLHVNFSFTISSKVYASFYDSSNQGWSVMFDNETALSDFAAYVCLGKFFCSDQSGIMTQDVSSGEGSPIQVGDNVEVRYTGRLIENHTLGREFDSNVKSEKLFRFKIGARKVIAGWEDGVINMMKGGHRILIVPPSKGYGDKGMSGRIPPNATLAFDIHVVRVKHNRGHLDSAASEKSTRSKRVDSPPLPSIPVTSGADNDDDTEEEAEDVNVKRRTRSIAEKLSINDSGSPVKNQNAKLLARMAKMGGQAVLPPSETGHAIPNPAPSESSFGANSPSEPDPGAYPSKVVHPKPNHAGDIPQYPSNQYNTAPPMSSAQPMYGELPPNQPSAFRPAVIPPSYSGGPPSGYPPAGFPGMPGQLMPYQSPAAAATMAMQQQMNLSMASIPPGQPQVNQVSTLESNKGEKTQDIHTAMLVSETRQQNTEVRVAISKLQDKVDKVWERMGDMKVSSGGLSYPSMEAGALLQNLTRIIQENERLKQEVVEQSDKIEKQNEKMNEMLHKSRSFIENSNRALELKNDDFKASATQSQQRVLDLEQDKLNLTKELSETTGEVTRLQCLVNEYKKIERDLKDKLVNATSTSEASKDEMVLLKSTVDETKKNLQVSEALHKEELNAKRELGRRLESSEEEVKSLQRRLADQEQDHNSRISVLEENSVKLNAELDRTRKDYERELDGVREKLRAERAVGFSEKSLELNKLEEEITTQWKSKCERMVRAERDRLTRQMNEVEEEKKRAEAEVAQYENRIDVFRNKALEMKQRFKEEIESLKDELEEAKAREREMDREELIKEVRRLMNQVFHAMRQRVSVDRRYRGVRVLELLKGTIRKMTLRLMGEEVSSSEEESESESEEEREDNSVELAQLRQQVVEQQLQMASLSSQLEQERREVKEEVRKKLAELQTEMPSQVTVNPEFNRESASENRQEAAAMETDEVAVEVNGSVADVLKEAASSHDSGSDEEKEIEGDDAGEREEVKTQKAEDLMDQSKETKIEETKEVKTESKGEHEESFVPTEDADGVTEDSLHPPQEKEEEVQVIELDVDDSPTAVDEDEDVLGEQLDAKSASIVGTEDLLEEVANPGDESSKVKEISEPFSARLSPPPLDSHDESSSDEDQEQRPSFLEGETEVAVTDDGEGAEFATPPSGAPTEVKSDESGEKQVDSTEFDDILSKPHETGPLLKTTEAERVQTTGEKVQTKTIDDNVPLFGDDSDDDYDDIFGISAKKEENATVDDDATAPKQVSLKESFKGKKEESNDDKPKPPPLFDDEDDDDFELFK